MDVSKSDINILLLGETGVGKSTFINSFANYVQYETFETALESELLCLIPTKFTFTDENLLERHVRIGDDKNEDQKIGNSATQEPKSYVFSMEGDDRKIRLIDTPGIGDSRGMTQDNTNFENILDYISQCDYLHAICFLLKPNVAVINPYFKFCLMHLLMRLEKSAAQNIIFVFTNTRTTFYRPGETLTNIRRIFKEVQSTPPYVKIPCDIGNIFCMDNEAFRFLVAVKDGVQFSDEETKNYSASWELSVTTSKRLIDCVAGKDKLNSVKPHLVKNTLSVNEARRVITDLSKPLVDISELVQDNLVLLERHQKVIAKSGQSIEEFKKNLYVPVVHIKQIKLDRPVTVCTSANCTERLPVSGNVMYHYKQRCHNPCGLRNVPKEHIGDPELLRCTAMAGQQSCSVCGCHFSTHMHINYETTKVDAQEESHSVKGQIVSAQDQIRIKKDLIAELQLKKSEYEQEKGTITKSLARFAYFLRENSISIFNDAYEEYLNYLIKRETQYGSSASKEFIERHVALKKEYEQEKKLLKTLLKDGKVEDSSEISADGIHVLVSKLYALKHTGKKIKELHEAQQSMRFKEHERKVEYHHCKPISRSGIIQTTKNTLYAIKNAIMPKPSFSTSEDWDVAMVMLRSTFDVNNFAEMLPRVIQNLPVSQENKNALVRMTHPEIKKMVSQHFAKK